MSCFKPTQEILFRLKKRNNFYPSKEEKEKEVEFKRPNKNYRVKGMETLDSLPTPSIKVKSKM